MSIEVIARSHGFNRSDLSRIWGCSEKTVGIKCRDEGEIKLKELRAMGIEPTISECFEIVTGRRPTYRELMTKEI